MAFRELDSKTATLLGRRVLIAGKPNSRKTTSLHTWPHSDGQLLHIMSYPGEKGHQTIDTTDPYLKAYVWEFDDVTKFSPHAVIKEVESTTWQILAGAKGPCQAFAGDGLHKLYSLYYQKCYLDLLTSESFTRGCEKGGMDPEAEATKRAYGAPNGPGAFSDFMLYLTRVCHSSVPYAVFTVWEEPERDNPDDPKSRASHIFPALPGKLAQRIVGEFDFVLYAEVGLPISPTTSAQATWQTQPGGKVWGVGAKLPIEIAKKLPATVPQDFGRLLQRLEAK